MPSTIETIDLRSDTLTRPTPAMRRAIADAEVGDDERDGDPTMLRLQSRVAELLGMEAALFFPSGVMANQAAVWLHSTPGTEILLDAEAHIIHWEAAGAAALSGVQARPVPASGDVMSAADLRRHLRPPSRFAPAASLVCVENTHNGAGGRITPLGELRAIRAVAREAGLPVHMDGARLWNAAVASGTPLHEWSHAADTMMLAFSKGLGAPVGAIVVGRAAAIEELWVIRKRLGGAMRQNGILAAAALYALDNHLERLAEDHEHARMLADAVDGAGGCTVVRPDTNIVMMDLPRGVDSAVVVKAAAERGVRIAAWNATRVRAVTHLDVSREQARRAGELLAQALEQAGSGRARSAGTAVAAG